jgi:[acyl-carrier-protein] S-malonyltransferase
MVERACEEDTMTAKRYALLFPGQGAQFLGMSLRWHERLAAVRDLFDRAEQRTGLPLRNLCFSTGRDAQARTDVTQPCVFVASLACLMWLRESLADAGTPYAPACFGGHSLGHFASLVAAGALDLDAGLDLVNIRGQIMYESSRRQAGGMAAIVGMPAGRVADLLVGTATVGIAAVNGPDQVVVSGARAGLDDILRRAQRAGAERVVPLAIGIAAHSPLMADAQARFATELAAVHLTAPELPVALNTTARLSQEVDEIRADLLVHMVRPVRWWESIQQMRRTGVSRFVDVGPGRTLGKVLRRFLPEDEVLANDKPAGIAGSLT